MHSTHRLSQVLIGLIVLWISGSATIGGSAIAAQTPTDAPAATDTDAEDVLRAALERQLSTSFRYQSIQTFDQTIEFENGEITESSTQTRIEGAVSAAGAEQAVIIVESMGYALQLERITIGDDVYVYFEGDAELYGALADVLLGGWRRADAVRAALTEMASITSQSVTFDLFVNTRSTAWYVVRNDQYWDSVTEGEAETLDGRAARRFSIEIDEIAALLGERPEGLEAPLGQIMRQASVTTSTVTATAWLDAETGDLMRIDAAGDIDQPYLDADLDPPLNIAEQWTATITFSDYGTAVEIAPPEVLAADP
ncbi:MAG: hypothetical protein SF162_16925 [bacterium]|nr:hypothetical protein [bacterium]